MPPARLFFLISLSWSLLFAPITAQVSAEEKPPVFEQQVQSLLKKKCGKCHSDTVQKGELDLSSIIGVRRGGESGESVVAKSLEESLLWTLVDEGDMPPEGQPRLSKGELALIRQWILAGSHSENPLDHFF